MESARRTSFPEPLLLVRCAPEEVVLGVGVDYRVRLCIGLMSRALYRPGAPRMGELARACNISASRLRHLFKAEMGMSPTQYVGNLRMREAERLLATTLLVIKEVAWRVGIPNTGVFSRKFKRAHGVPPKCYRTARQQHVGEGCHLLDSPPA